MQLKNILEFSGTQEDSIQPSDFLKMVKCSFLATRTTSDSQKINLFELYLKSDSLAEEWYNNAKTPKKVWAELELEFKKRFPNVKKAMKMTPELERELGAMRITTEELGETEKYKGEEVYMHMIFAEKILDLAKCTKIENSTSGLWGMRDELPEVLQEKIPENQASWMAFTQAIRAVDMGHIRAVLYPPPLIPPGSGWNARNPGGSKQNGRNLVGLQVNSNLSPSKKIKILNARFLTTP